MFYGIPWAEIRNDFHVMNKVRSNQRPKQIPDARRAIGPVIPDDVWKIIQDCWQNRPDKRPTATEVVGRLRVLYGARIHQTYHDDQGLISSTQIFKEAFHPFSSLFSDVDEMLSLSTLSDTSVESMST